MLRKSCGPRPYCSNSICCPSVIRDVSLKQVVRTSLLLCCFYEADVLSSQVSRSCIAAVLRRGGGGSGAAGGHSRRSSSHQHRRRSQRRARQAQAAAGARRSGQEAARKAVRAGIQWRGGRPDQPSHSIAQSSRRSELGSRYRRQGQSAWASQTISNHASVFLESPEDYKGSKPASGQCGRPSSAARTKKPECRKRLPCIASSHPALSWPVTRLAFPRFG